MSLRDVSLQRRCISHAGQSCPFSGFDPLVAGGKSSITSQDRFSQGSPCQATCWSVVADGEPVYSLYIPILHYYMLRLQHVATEGARRERSCIWRPKRSIRAGDQNVPCRALWSRISIDGDKKQLFLFEDKVRPLRFWTCDRRAAFPNSDVNSLHIQMHFRRLHWSNWSLKGSIKAKKFQAAPSYATVVPCSMLRFGWADPLFASSN